MDEPVSIDIRLRQNVEEEADKASRSMDRMAETSDEVWKHSQEAFKLQQEVIARLKNELAGLQKEFKKVNVGTSDPKLFAERKKQAQAIHAVMEELKGEEKALGEMMSASDQAAQKAKSLETRMREVREELAAMAMAGKKDTAEYRAKEQQLGTLATAYREIYQTQLQLSKGGASLQGIISGLSAMSGLFSAGAGAMGLFNANSEAYNKIQTKMQSLIAITIGLQQVQQTLYQTSAFRIQTVTRAKQLWTTTTNRLTVALGISNVAAKALMGTLTLGLSVAIGAAIAVIDKLVSRHKEAREEANKFNESVANNSADQVASYEKLRTSYAQLAGDMKSKHQFILNNQDAFKQLGVSIATVNEADNLFIYNTEAFKNALLERAKASASMELAADKYKLAIQKRAEADNRERTPTTIQALTGKEVRMTSPVLMPMGKTTFEKVSNSAKKMRDEATKLEEAAEAYITQYLTNEKNAAELLKNSEIRTSEQLEKGTKSWWEAQKKTAQAKLDAMKDSQIGTNEWKQVVGEISKADRALKKFEIDSGVGNKISNTKEEEEKLGKLAADIQSNIDASIVAAMQEGKEKKLKELENDYNQRMYVIKEKEKELEKIEKKGVDVSKQKEQLNKLEEKEKDNYEAGITAIETGANDAIAEVMNEINARFKTQSQTRLDDIDQFYAEQTKKAKNNGAIQAQLDEIGLKHKQDIELEKHFIALETLDFEEQIALRKSEIENVNVQLQSQLEEKKLQIQKLYAEKRLQMLENIKKNGGDVDAEIASVNAEVEGLNAGLSEMPVKQLQEIGSYMDSIISSIGSFAEIFDEGIANAFNIASNTISGLASIASLTPQGIIQGAQQLLDVVGKIISLNRNASKEIKEFNQNLAKEAIDYSIAVIKSIKDIKSATDNIFTDNYTNTLTQGMNSYNAAVKKQKELIEQLGDVSIKTGVKKQKILGVTVGTKNIYENLLKEYPDLINKDGELNRELAETLKNSGRLSKEATNLIDGILEAEEASSEAMRAVEDQLQNLVGALGDELKEALDSAFASGTDSAKEMTDNVVEMIRNIATQKLFNATFGNLFSQLEERLKESYGSAGDQDMVDDIEWFMENYPSLVDAYNQGLAAMQNSIQLQYGLDAFNNLAEREAVNKGIAQASQDSIDELNGRITFITMKVSDMGTISAKQLDMGNEQLLVMKTMLSQIDIMTENSEFLKKLDLISEDIAKMQRDGIIIKR